AKAFPSKAHPLRFWGRMMGASAPETGDGTRYRTIRYRAGIAWEVPMVTSLMLLVFAGWIVPPGGGPFPPRPATGKIAGKVILSTAVTSRKMRFRLYSDLGPAAAPKPST